MRIVFLQALEILRIAHRVMDINIDAQKTPYIIETTPEMQFSLKTFSIKEMAVFQHRGTGGIP